jgi:hypothetical protein
MSDLSKTILPKSNQMNADDLIVGSKLITITAVKISEEEQPVSVFYEGDEGKPWKPCKSMLRVLIHVWGAESTAYIGRHVRLVLDPSVIWAGKAVGGIRIAEMSHLEQDRMFMLTEKKGSRKPYTVKILPEWVKLDGAKNMEELKILWESFPLDIKKAFRGDLEIKKNSMS